jgi:hypothetical protein
LAQLILFFLSFFSFSKTIHFSLLLFFFLRTLVADPYLFDAGPDPVFSNNMDPDSAAQNDAFIKKEKNLKKNHFESFIVTIVLN